MKTEEKKGLEFIVVLFVGIILISLLIATNYFISTSFLSSTKKPLQKPAILLHVLKNGI